MNELSPEHLSWLEHYGFDPVLFESWQKSVREGFLSADHNVLQAEILAPPPGSIAALPKEGSPEHQRLVERGSAEIATSAFGVVVLNGGMATRFGGVVKGVVEVLPGGRTFLALVAEDILRAQQRHGGRIPLYLMNSFATEEATIRHLEDHRYFGLDPEQVHHFNQFVSLRMEPDGSVFYTEDGDISPYGPGHGDFAPAFRSSGCLRQFLDSGGRYLLVRNVDNLGARVSPAILGHHIDSGAEMTVEVAPKWPEDVGGAPYLVDGKLRLVEQIRYPKDFDPDIVDVFNTNTFTFTAAALDRDFDLGWYYVEKTVEGRKAVQIERLIGELTWFLTTNYVRVRRTGPDNRFLPIKTPEDLEAAREEIAEIYGA